MRRWLLILIAIAGLSSRSLVKHHSKLLTPGAVFMFIFLFWRKRLDGGGQIQRADYTLLKL